MNKLIYTVGIVDTPNKNNRVYPREVMEKAIVEVQGRIKNKTLFVTEGCNLSDSGNADLSNTVGTVKDMKIVDDNVAATVEIIETEAGKYLKNRLNGGVPYHVRTSGIGKLTMDDKGHDVVSDYEMTHLTFTMEGA
jgi:hypothetical protein